MISDRWRKTQFGLKMLRRTKRWFAQRSRRVIQRLTENNAPNALPVLIVGAQRSGTTIFGRCLERSPEVEYYPERNGTAFHHFRLRELPHIRRLVRTSPFSIVALKPLLDSHRVVEILSTLGKGKAIWLYRNYQDCTNSAVAQFQEGKLNVIHDFARNREHHGWIGEGLMPQHQALLENMAAQTLNLHEGVALFWYLRNSLFFDQQLDRRVDVLPVAYEQFVIQPMEVMQRVCRFLGCHYVPGMIHEVHARSIGRWEPPAVNQRLHTLCMDMYQRLKENRLTREHELFSLN